MKKVFVGYKDGIIGWEYVDTAPTNIEESFVVEFMGKEYEMYFEKKTDATDFILKLGSVAYENKEKLVFDWSKID